MDEEQYRQTFQSLNPRPCAFEKSIHSRRTGCSRSHRFCLADREGVACQSEAHLTLCNQFLQQLRPKALFALHLTKLVGALPHAKEIKIQTGGLFGVYALLHGESAPKPVDFDISAMLEQLKILYPDFETLPYEQLIRVLAHYEERKKNRRE